MKNLVRGFRAFIISQTQPKFIGFGSPRTKRNERKKRWPLKTQPNSLARQSHRMYAEHSTAEILPKKITLRGDFPARKFQTIFFSVIVIPAFFPDPRMRRLLLYSFQRSGSCLSIRFCFRFALHQRVLLPRYPPQENHLTSCSFFGGAAVKGFSFFATQPYGRMAPN